MVSRTNRDDRIYKVENRIKDGVRPHQAFHSRRSFQTATGTSSTGFSLIHQELVKYGERTLSRSSGVPQRTCSEVYMVDPLQRLTTSTSDSVPRQTAQRQSLSNTGRIHPGHIGPKRPRKCLLCCSEAGRESRHGAVLGVLHYRGDAR